nr:hypothetical protein Itr_chr07CG10620 [Ipomoea trifida]
MQESNPGGSQWIGLQLSNISVRLSKHLNNQSILIFFFLVTREIRKNYLWVVWLSVV